MSDAPASRGLGWAHGALSVQRLGAMLAPLTFVLPDGRQVSPLHIAPWAGDPGANALPGILRRLRGDWPCVPFGYTAPAEAFPEDWARLIEPAPPGEEAHGHSSNAEWSWEQSGMEALKLSLDYPEDSPVRRVERTITPDPDAAAVDIELKIEVRRDCRLPIGLHPVFRLPAKLGDARVEPGRFDHGVTYPTAVAPEAPLFAPDRRLADLAAIPLRNGGTLDATSLPFEQEAEELIQLAGAEGTIALHNRAEGYRVRLSWNAEHFPSLLLWFSNRGRKGAPWSGRHVALGIEPVCAPFDLGTAVAIANNPIAQSGTPTARQFRADEAFITRYRISAEPA